MKALLLFVAGVGWVAAVTLVFVRLLGVSVVWSSVLSVVLLVGSVVTGAALALRDDARRPGLRDEVSNVGR